ALVVLADTLYDYANGRASLWDVAFAALDCIPGMKGLTTLGGLARGIRSLATTGLRGLRQGALGLGRAVRRSGRAGDDLVLRSDPIDMATGEMVMDATDLRLPGVLPLVLRRHHRTGLRTGGWLGPSWACTLDQRLLLEPAGVRLVTDDGMVLDYPRPLSDAPVLPVEGPRWELSWDGRPGGEMTVRQPEADRTLHFGTVPGRPGAELPLTAISDRHGNRIRIAHDANGTPTDVAHDAGYHVGVTTEDGRLTELRLLSAPDRPVLLRYGYDERGNLAEIRDSTGVPLTFTYDRDRRMTGWVDRTGTWYRYRYDDRGRCVATEGVDGVLSSSISYDTETRRTLFTDSLGHTTVYEFNDCYQLVTETDASGHHTRRAYDRYDRLLSLTDPLGHTTTCAYDERGELVELVRPDGRRTRFTRDEDGRWTEAVGADGLGWRREFDERGNLVRVVDPVGAVTRYTHDERGRHTSTTSALGNTTRIETDAAGLRLAVTDPLGGTVTIRRDAFGRPVSHTDPLGATTSVEWTLEGRPLRVTDAQGGTRSWTWDAGGNPLSLTDPHGATTRWTYGPFDQVATRTDPDGTRHHFTRDTELRLTRVTGPDGLTWEYSHDAAGRTVAETDFDGRSFSYTHDACGRLAARTNPLGEVTRYTRDSAGHVVSSETAGARTDFTLDAEGRVLRATSPDVEIERVWDPMGRLLSETCDGRTVSHEYDLLGRLTSTTTPSGHRTSHGYDAAGHRITLTSDRHHMAIQRDAAGHELRRTIDARVGFDHTWDDLGRLSRQTVTVGSRTVRERGYRYRADHQLTGLTDSLDGDLAFDLDAMRRVTGVTGRDWTERYAYDAAGNQTVAHWPPAAAGAEEAGTRTHTGTRVTTAGRTRYVYDDAGRTIVRQITRLSRKPDTWRYTWDAEGRLAAVTTPDGTRWTYLYDPFGRRVAKRRHAADGTVVERTDFSWAGPLLVEQVTTGRQETGGTTVSWDYDGRRPVAQTERATSDDIDARFYAIVTDLVGTPTELVDEAGEIAWRARPTLWGLGAPAPGATTDTPLRFPGQYADAETGWHYNVHRHYDPATGRYTSPDPLGLAPAANPVTYVPNPHRFTDLLGLAAYEGGGAAPDAPDDGLFPNPGGRADRETVFSGHGDIDHWDVRTTVVPEGTTLAMYCRHGETITDDFANDIELESPWPVELYGPGSEVPNYWLRPPDGLTVLGQARTVDVATRLSDLLEPNMGRVHWAACREIYGP
ncbi:RHS repeat protein, partial [Streptomyces sp. 8K308]|uniref:putative adhesin n=1 Tax=Streptomyces sp. 8K308 TaxID=2530388 RepID=UPI001047BFE7